MEDKKVIMTEGIEIQQIDNDALVLEPKSMAFYKLNETAKEILNYCDGKNTVHNIAELIAKNYEMDSDEVLKDVIELVGNLQEINLVKLI